MEPGEVVVASGSTTPPLKLAWIPVSQLHPNPWNPNVMAGRVYEAERESIRKYGFVDPLLVRPHPQIPGEWQVVDGEHRLKAAVDEGHTKLPCLPRNLAEPDARRLTVILNETRGHPDVQKLGQLLASLQRTAGNPEDLMLGLPYSEATMSHLLEAGATDEIDLGGGNGRGGVTLREFVVACDDDQYDRLTSYVGMLMRETGSETVAEAILPPLAAACQQL